MIFNIKKIIACFFGIQYYKMFWSINKIKIKTLYYERQNLNHTLKFIYPNVLEYK